MARAKVTHPIPLHLKDVEPVTKSRDELREELLKLALRDSSLSKSIDKANENDPGIKQRTERNSSPLLDGAKGFGNFGKASIGRITVPPINAPSSDPAKIMEIGKSGSGKTGSLASLVAAGYRLRIMDTNKGINALRSLLTNYKYPYRKYCETHGINIGSAVSYVPIDQNMRVCDGLIPGEKAGEIKPKDARAWDRATGLLTNWIDGDLKLGNINTWTDKNVLVINSFSTLAYDCYYFVQSFNGRLGAREEGYDFQRNVGGAQSLLRRMLELLYSTSVKCNVIIISHLTWVDTSQGYAQSPEPARPQRRNA